MALHVGLRREKPLGGLLGYSGALAGPETLSDEMTSPTAIQLIHGDADDVVPVQALYAAEDALTAAGLSPGTHISHGAPHSIAPDGVMVGRDFLEGVLAPAKEPSWDLSRNS